MERGGSLIASQAFSLKANEQRLALGHSPGALVMGRRLRTSGSHRRRLGRHSAADQKGRLLRSQSQANIPQYPQMLSPRVQFFLI